MIKTKNGVTSKRGQILLYVDMHARTLYLMKYHAQCYLGFHYITTVERYSGYSLMYADNCKHEQWE